MNQRQWTSRVHAHWAILLTFVALLASLSSYTSRQERPADGSTDVSTITLLPPGEAEGGWERIPAAEQERIIAQALDELWKYTPDLQTHRPPAMQAQNENGLIAYVGNDGRLYVMNPDGTGQEMVVAALTNVFRPAWSHDGLYLAFAADGSDGRCLYKYHLNTGTHTTLACNFSDIDWPEWSPHNGRLVFYGEQGAGSGYGAWALNADGSGLRRLAPGLEQNWRPTWIDENRVAFPGETEMDVWQLYTVTFAQPDNPEAITPSFQCSAECSCGSGGGWVTFPHALNGQLAFLGAYTTPPKLAGCTLHYGVFLTDPDGATDPSLIADVAASTSSVGAGMLLWSPDNQHLGVVAGENNNFLLKVVYPNDGSVKVLNNRAGVDWHGLSWSQDAATIATGFQVGDNAWELDLVDVEANTFTTAAEGRHPAWGTVPAAPMPETDLSITHIEITQGLQDWEQSIALIAGKTTFARVYATATVDTANVTARLSATVDGQPLDPPSIDPQNSGGRIIVRSDGGDRGHIYDNFYFHLPESWLVEGVDLMATIDPDEEIFETDENNNSLLRTLPYFEKVEPLDIHIVRVVDLLDPKIADFSDAHVAATWLEQAYPVSEVRLHNHGGLLTIFCPLYDDFCWGLVMLQLRLSLYLSGNVRGPHVRVYGIVHQDVNTQGPHPFSKEGTNATDWFCCAGGKVGTLVPPSSLAANKDLNPRHHYGRIMAHELGHSYDLPHLKNPPSAVNSACVDPSGDAINPEDAFANGHIGDIENPEGSYYGFNSYPSIPQIYTPAAYDMMTYCYDRYWISGFSFNKLLAPLRQSEPSQLSDITDGQHSLMVSGVITTTTNTVSLRPFYVFNDLIQSSGDDGGDYSIELFNVENTLLVKHEFNLAQMLVSPPSDIAEAALFMEVLPYDPTTSYIQIKHGTEVLSVVPVSANPPQLTLTTPNGGEVLTGQVTVTWAANDADGDQLTYALRYSADEGITWTALAVDLREQSYELDTSELPGTEQGLIQIIASDGVNTTTDASDGVFSVPKKDPIAYISLPSDESAVPPKTGVTFVGSGYDPEDGPLADAQLSWSSNRDGALGTGELIMTNGLSTGRHIITLTARDSDGNQSATSISIFVGYKVNLPVIMRD